MSLIVLFLGIGKLTIYIVQKSPYSKIFKWRFLTELFECDLCLGVWVYTFLSFAFEYIWFKDAFGYVPIVSELLTGITASIIMWIFSEGWNSKFREYVIKD